LRSQTGPYCCKFAFTSDAVLYATLDAALFIFHKLALFFVYIAAAITVAALATVFVHTLNAALPAGFTPVVFCSSSRCYSCSAPAICFPADPPAPMLFRNKLPTQLTNYGLVIIFIYNLPSIIT